MTQPTESANTHESEKIYERSVPWMVHGIVSVLILGVAFAIVSMVLNSKPEANKWGDRPAPRVAVEVEALRAQSYEVWIDSYGTAESLTRTRLVSEVNGRVMSVSPDIRPGMSFAKGDVLIELDDRDFKVEVDIAASAAADAEVAYLQEVAQAEFAAQEWNTAPETEAARKLAFREPQLAAAQAALRAAKARLDRAKLNLERTRITAPFDGKVLQQMVDVGQVVSPSQAIAEIYSTDVVEVRLPIKMADLQHVELPENASQNPQRAKVILESELGSNTYQWQGEIVRTEGTFDPATRMLYAVAQVFRPFEANEERPAMRIGQFVRAKVQGSQYDNVFVIPRRAISQDFLVSVALDGVLVKRRVTPLWTDDNAVVISANATASSEKSLRETDMLVLTPTANLPDGTRVKPLNPFPSSADSSNRNQRGERAKPASAERADKKAASGEV